jgi:alanine racemase
MDMLMLDVTDIPDVRPGDEVLIFGQQGEHRISVTQLATAADTIPYEILVRISPRVRRVYVRE